MVLLFILSDKEPVAGNYYPVNSRAFIKDSFGIQLTVLTDRSVGGSSIRDGSLEFMVHRRLLYSDGTVDGEPLNEPGTDGRGLIIRGKFLVLLETTKNSARLHRMVGEEEFLRPLIAFSKNVERKKKGKAIYETLTRPLPRNINILSLENLGEKLILRLEHLFAQGEDSELSKPVSISLNGLFKYFKIISISELNLSADIVRRELDEDFISEISPTDQNFLVTLKPMQIKTFSIEVNWHEKRSHKVFK